MTYYESVEDVIDAIVDVADWCCIRDDLDDLTPGLIMVARRIAERRGVPITVGGRPC